MTSAATPSRTSPEVWKTGGLLAALIVHNLIYPLTYLGVVGPVVFYLLYSGMFVAATFALSRNSALRSAALVTGAATFVLGLWNVFAGTPATAFGIYVASILYHGVIIIVLSLYIFTARTVLMEILLAATSLYLVIGSLFAAIFALLVWFDPGAFSYGGDTELTWQQLLYFSYVTLTSLGFGDILPVSFYAQAFTAFEAIVGVLYTVILLSRLVGMHSSSRE